MELVPPLKHMVKTSRNLNKPNYLMGKRGSTIDVMSSAMTKKSSITVDKIHQYNIDGRKVQNEL